MINEDLGVETKSASTSLVEKNQPSEFQLNRLIVQNVFDLKTRNKNDIYH